MLDGKETYTKTSMCGNIKPVLEERGSKLPRQKSSRPDVLFLHPQIISVEVSHGF
jgi:hypothetical protein